ncbi:MAG: sigma-70 family RNA polymerase sigma factor [Clostridiales bacterium]|nr:sigma-70 family RNA polymerase sigma factor [Clostridiales bacterium]
MERGELTELIAKAQSGDQGAMEELLRAAHTPVSYQCRKLLKDPRDAEDMTQEVLLTAYSRLNLLKNPEAFWGWLNSITINRCMSALKRNHVELQFEEDEEGHSVLDDLEDLDEQQVPDKALDNTETTRMIEEIVNGLPEAQRICTLMFYYDEMTVKEIAEVIGAPENTVKSRLNYARKAIKERVLDYEKKGIKLYGLSPLPFLLYFLGRAAKEGADPAKAGAAAKRVMELGASAAAGGAAAAGTAAVSGTSSAAGAAAASEAASTAGTAVAAGSSAAGGAAATAGTAMSHFLGGLSMKAVAGILATILAVGGIAGAVVLANQDEPEPAVSETVLVEEEPHANGGGLTPEDPGPLDSPYDTVTEYDPDTYIARTTLVTDLNNVEVYYEFPVFPETTAGARIINAFFQGLRNEFFQDRSGEIARVLEWAPENPAVDFGDTYRCTIGTYNDELASVYWTGEYTNHLNVSYTLPAYTFHSDTGRELNVLEVLGCTPMDLNGYLTQALTAESILGGSDLLDDVTQYPFYVEDGAVFVGVNVQMYRGLRYVKLDVPLQTGGSTPSAPSPNDLSDLLGSIAYYGDPAQCRMTADQARAFAEVIRSQSAKLEQLYEQHQRVYDERALGVPRQCYAALVDAGNGIPFLIFAGGLISGIDDHSVYWEYLCLFTIWQYVDGQAVRFWPADASIIGTITSSGVWFGWDGITPYHYLYRHLNAILYPFQDGTISMQAAHTLYGDSKTNTYTIDGKPASRNELDAALADYTSDIWVTHSMDWRRNGGYFTGVCPAEQVLEVLTEWGDF